MLPCYPAHILQISYFLTVTVLRHICGVGSFVQLPEVEIPHTLKTLHNAKNDKLYSKVSSIPFLINCTEQCPKKVPVPALFKLSWERDNFVPLFLIITIKCILSTAVNAENI